MMSDLRVAFSELMLEYDGIAGHQNDSLFWASMQHGKKGPKLMEGVLVPKYSKDFQSNVDI